MPVSSMIRFSLTMLAASLVAGCAGSVDPSTYAHEKPALELSSYFNGRLLAWGVFQDRSGKVVKRFTVTMDCQWHGDDGTLDEKFDYSDGSKQERLWKLHKTSSGPLSGNFTGTAGDVVGQATGSQAGNALHWQYVLAVPIDGKTINFDFDDWMFLVDDHVMLNHSVMSKWGIKAGEVVLSFTKP